MNIFRSTLLVTLVLGSISLSFAQGKNKFYFTDVYTIKGRSQYSHLRVLDMRLDKYNLGFLTRGPFEKKVTLRTERPLGEMLSEQFTKMLSASKDGNEEDELLLVLYDVRVESKEGDDRVGTFFWDGDFYARKGYEKYLFLGTVDSTYEARPGDHSVNEVLIKGMRINFGYVLSKYATDTAIAKWPLLTETELLARRKNEKNKYKIYESKNDFRKGVYFTEEQFLNNEPVDTPFYIKRYAKSASPKRFWSVYVYDTLSGKKVQIPSADVFAVYDGENWVSGMSHEFTSMEFKNGEFYAVKWCKGVRDLMPGAFLMGAVGGILVALDEMKHPGLTEYYTRYNPEKRQFVPLHRIH